MTVAGAAGVALTPGVAAVAPEFAPAWLGTSAAIGGMGLVLNHGLAKHANLSDLQLS
jgi:hypothetical protein